LALETFGSEVISDNWLNSSNAVLGATPLLIIETSSGASEVKKILYAIKYGGVI